MTDKSKMDVKTFKEFHPNVYNDIREHFEENYPGEDPDVLMAELNPMEAFDIFLQWNGIGNYTSTICDALYACASSSDDYIINTDGERDGWFEEKVGAA